MSGKEKFNINAGNQPNGGIAIRQTDTICLCGAGRPVRHDPVASPQDGTPTKQVSDKTEP